MWGEWHLDAMRRVMLPTLLSPGNLPAIRRRFPLRYRIATTPADRRRIEAWPIFSRLAAAVEVEWITENASPDITYHIEWYKRSLSDAKAANAYCFMAYPDVAWSDGLLNRCADAVAAGKVGVAIPYLRVISETFVPDIASQAGDAEIALSGSELVRLGMRHMHPLSVAAMAGGQHALPSLEVSWRVPGQGVLLREVSRELSMVDTERLQANQYWNAIDSANPQSLHVAADSDDMLMLSIAPLFKDFHVYIPHHSLQPIDMARVSLHPANNNPLVKHFAAHRIRLHYHGLEEDRWREVERRADNFIGQALFMREFVRIWDAVRTNDCSLASQAMSVALITTSLARTWRYAGPVTAYIPTDDAFKDRGWESVASLLRPEMSRELKDIILNHVAASVVAGSVSRSTQQVALSGAPIHCRTDNEGDLVKGARILRRLDVAPHHVCIVDRLLVPSEVAISSKTRALRGSRSAADNQVLGSGYVKLAPRPSKETRVVQALGGIRAQVVRTGSAFATKLHLRAIPTVDEDIARHYETFLRHFALRLDKKDLRRQKRAAATALYQAGLYRHKLLFLYELMKRFSTQADPTEPQPAFFNYCSSLIGGEQDLLHAARYYSLALQLLPDFAEALYGLGLLKRRAGLSAEAIALFEAAVTAKPHPNALPHAHITANSWRNLAEIHRDLGDNDVAEACFRNALNHLGIHGVYHMEIADFMRMRGHLAEAAKHYELLMSYSHVYPSHFTEPDYPPEDRLPSGPDGRPCDPLRPTVVPEGVDGGRLVYWWHLYLTIPPGAPFDVASLIKMRPPARPMAKT